MLFIAALMLNVAINAQETEETRKPLIITGGPQLRYQNLNGLNGVFFGGSGCFKISERLNLTAQGFILTNGNEYAGNVESNKLKSGYGGFGAQIRFLKIKSFNFYSDLTFVGGGYAFETGSDINFKSFSIGIRAKRPINHFVSAVIGISNPFYYYSSNTEYKLYQRSPIFSLSIEFGQNQHLK